MLEPVSAIDTRFAQRLKLVRHIRGLTQVQLGTLAGMTFYQVRDAERHQFSTHKPTQRRTTVGEGMRLSAALQVPYAWMYDPRPLPVEALPEWLPGHTEDVIMRHPIIGD